jgi:hypothetical protein
MDKSTRSCPSAQVNLLETALAYARRGWPVLPLHTATNGGCSCDKPDCSDIGKHPRFHVTDLQHGLKDATTDDTLIRRWWQRWRHANIGIVTGKVSGLVVIDVDPRHGGDLTLEDLEAEHGKFPETVENLTGGGGRHLFYQHPGGELRCGTDALGPGVDIKADGGYVVAPPSRHASGRRYEWEVSSHPDDVTIAPLPTWFPLHEDIPHAQVSDFQPHAGEAGQGGPGDDFNRRATADDLRAILSRHGWAVVEHRDGIDYLRRPGKTGRSYSATLGAVAPNIFYCFSTKGEPFDARHGYKPFSVYGLLDHGGDFKAAAKALADAGYGHQRHYQHAANQNGQGPAVDDDDLPKISTSDDQQPSSRADDVLPPYVLKGHALYYRKPGTTDDQLLGNFMAYIREERTEDDGAELKRIVGMEATIQDGKYFSDIPVPIADFYSLAGLLKALGTEAVVSPGPLVKDRIRHAIQLYSHRQGYPQRQVFAHLGWRQIDGAWCYLHAGGSIPAKVEVSAERALERYALPAAVSPQPAIQASLRMVACAPLRITIPLLAAVYLAPLSEWLKPDFTIWLEGPSGARKSTLAALAVSHYGAFDRVHPPDSWESTANELERLTFLAKDVLLWIDDYAPRPSAKEMQDQERKAQRIIRAQGNLSGRARMRADMSLRPAYYPRGVTLSTGELHPTGTSTFARMLQLEVGPDDTDLRALAASQADSPLLAEAMVAYIQWLQSQLETLVPALHERWLELRATALSELTHHTRHPEVFAHLMIAWELFLGFACAMGVLSDQERQERREAGLHALIEAINQQRLDAAAEDPVQRFRSHIQEAFIQGKVYVSDDYDGPPPDASRWGWSLQTIYQQGGTTSDEWKPFPGASMLGWVDDEFLYLIPDASYRLVYENLQRAGIMLVPQHALWKLLVSQGHLQRGKNRYTTLKRIGAERHWVLKLNRQYIDPPISPQSDDSDDNDDSAL